MPVLHHAWASTCSQKVRLALAEKQIAFEGRVLNLRRFEQLRQEFLALNPDGVVPVLVHCGAVIRESTIINDYLDDAFPQVPLRPGDACGRARVAMWNRFIDDVPTLAVKLPSFQRNMRPFLLGQSPEVLQAAFARFPDPETARRWRQAAVDGIPEPELARAHARLARTLERIEHALQAGPWLIGDRYTLADINMVPFVHRMASFDEYPLGDPGTSCWPAVADWYARIRARPAFARAQFVEQTTVRDLLPTASASNPDPV